ncbi:MAG: hypothetical protein IJK04_07560 [Kiritimatiellae bacterium]|nr:hypothetical protein [Kiritimatiellia bacterium]
MIEEEQLLVKGALELIGAAGGTGALKSKLFSALRNLDGTPLTPEQQDAVFCQLERRGWITSHLDPIWHNKRWTLTERGLTALEGM